MDYNQTTLDSDLSKNLELSAATRDYLLEVTGWTRFIAIVGFVFVGLMVVGALFFMIGASSVAIPGLGVGVGTLAVIYLLMAALYFFPILYLFRFATKTRYALETMDSIELEDGMANLKAHFKFLGILIIIMLAFYALMIVVALFTGLSSSLF